MADGTYSPAIYRQQGGNRFVVASTGSLDVEAGGEIDIEAGGELNISGTAFITTGAKVDLSSARNWLSSGVYAPGPGKFTGGVTSTGIGTFDSVTSTAGTAGSGKFNSVTSTGTGTFNAVTSTGIGTFDSVTSTGGTVGSGKFNSITSTGAITGNSFASTGTASVAGGYTSTAASFSSTGSGTAAKFDAVTSTGTGTFNAVTSTGAVSGGFVNLLETIATTTVTALNNYGVSVLGSSSLAENQQHTIVPVAGVSKFFIVVSSVTSASVAVLTTGTWDGTNNLLTMATTSGATSTFITALATSTDRWRLLWTTASSNYSLSAV